MQLTYRSCINSSQNLWMFKDILKKKKLSIQTFSTEMGPSRLFTVLSIFKYFYSIAERADWIARELDAGAKRKTWLGRVWVGTVKNKATFCKDVYNLSILRLAHFIRLPAPTPACVTLASLDFSFACQWKLERLWIVYGQASSLDPGNHWHVRTSG